MEDQCKFSEEFNDEFYQISHGFMQAVIKRQLPLDIYAFNPKSCTLSLKYSKDTKLSLVQKKEAKQLSAQGYIYISRQDKQVYIDLISYQIGLLLLDQHLEQDEAYSAFDKCLSERINNFFETMHEDDFDRLCNGFATLSQYISKNENSLHHLLNYLHIIEYSLTSHSLNCVYIGLPLYLSNVSKINVKELYRLCLGLALHDIGMQKIPGFVTNKQQRLKLNEKKKVEQHPEVGVKMLKNLGVNHKTVLNCVLEHHERIDGSGYPFKYHHKQLSLHGKICSVVDSFAAMISKRPHANAVPPLKAARILASETNKYDSQIVAVLIKLLQNNNFLD